MNWQGAALTVTVWVLAFLLVVGLARLARLLPGWRWLSGLVVMLLAVTGAASLIWRLLP